MADLIKFLKGVKSKLTGNLNLAEPCYITDEERLYIGGLNGNVPLPNKQDIDAINAQLDSINAQLAEEVKIILSDSEPTPVNNNTYWLADLGDTTSFNIGDGISVENATISDTEPNTDLWFKTN